jgi:hypothetical protein
MVGCVFDQLGACVNGVVGLDPDSLSDAELHAHVVDALRQLDRLSVAVARLVQRWDSRQVWADDGSKSPAARLARECGASPRTAGCAVRRARSLTSMPVTTGAGANGGLSVDKVDLLASANTAARREMFVAQEAALVEVIRPLRYAQATRAVRYWCARVDAELGGDTPPADVTGRLHVSATLDGKVVIDGMLDAVGGSVVSSEIERLIVEQRQADADAGTERSLPQLRAAALVEMARRSTSAIGRPGRPLVTVLVGHDAFRNVCELSNGTVITPAQWCRGSPMH